MPGSRTEPVTNIQILSMFIWTALAATRSTGAFHGVLSGSLLPELLGEPDEDSLGTPDVAEPVDAFVVHDFIDHRRAELAEPGEGVVEVLDGEHDAQVPQRVHRGCAVIGRDGGGVEARELEAAVAVGGEHHGDLDALAAHAGDAAG